jgi:glycosyltransferase involved in cell wall biosynthesis
MNRQDIMVSVVTVLNNDAAIVRPFVAEVTALLAQHYEDYELILVDDCSSDETAPAVRELLKVHAKVRLIRFSRNFGFDTAVSAGLDSALGDCVVVMDIGTDPLEPLPSMIEMAHGQSCVVVGRSIRKKDGFLRRQGRMLAESVCRRLFGLSIRDMNASYFAFPQAVVLSITRDKAKVRCLPSIAQAVGFAQQTYSYQRIGRGPKARRTAWGQQLHRLMTFVLSSGVNPLRAMSHLGLAACALNLVYTGYIVLVNLLKSQVAEGWTTLSLQVSGLFFFVFCMLWVISEYLGFILEESRDRPLYHVLDEINSTAPTAERTFRNVVSHTIAEQQFPEMTEVLPLD